MANLAPGSLGVVQEFVNTLELEPDGDREAIGTPAAFGAWLVEHRLARRAAVSAPEHALGLELREALRRLLLANNGGALYDEDLATLNRVATGGGLRPRFVASSRAVLEPTATGVPGALGMLVAGVSEAMSDGTWSRLKACADPGCQWAFYDRSKNHSGHWCSMEVCGNRAKARQFRQRQRSR